MNTSAVSSPASLLQAIASTPGKQDMGASPDAPSFNQVLSREMSGQDSPAAAAPNNVAAPAAPVANKDAGKAVQQSDGGNKDDSAKSDTTSAKQDTASADGTKAEDDKVTSAKDAKKDEDKNVGNTDVTTDQASIAAFVAALTNAKAAPAPSVTTTAATASTAAAATATVAAALDGKAEIKARNDRVDVASRIVTTDSATTNNNQDAVGKKSDFVSALDKAKADTGGDAKDPATAAKSVDLAAAPTTAAVKLPDVATMTTPQTFAAAIAAAVVQPATNMQNATRSTELLPAVGTAGWDDALGQKVVWMVKGAEQTATLTLNPPELGPMQVTVNVSNNQATANFVAHQPEVRHALEASMPRLREMLNEAGIQLGQSSVSAGMPNQQGGADEARQGSSGRRAARTDGITADATTQVTHVPTPLGGTGMVDTFA